jgi:hypothetical protein
MLKRILLLTVGMGSLAVSSARANSVALWSSTVCSYKIADGGYFYETYYVSHVDCTNVCPGNKFPNEYGEYIIFLGCVSNP